MIDIIDALNEGEFTTPKWYSLGLQLRISHDDLRTIEADFRNVDRCLTKCIVKWLKTGKATYTELAEALGKMGEDAAAYHISECVYIFILCITLECYETIMTHSCLVMFREQHGAQKGIKHKIQPQGS